MNYSHHSGFCCSSFEDEKVLFKMYLKQRGVSIKGLKESDLIKLAEEHNIMFIFRGTDENYINE